MPPFYTTTPHTIRLIEAGLKAKKYNRESNEVWLHHQSWQQIAGATIWTAPNENTKIIIYRHAIPPVYAIIDDAEDMRVAMNTLDHIINEIKTVAAVVTAPTGTPCTDIIPWPPSSPHVLLPNQTERHIWQHEDLTRLMPERMQRFFKLTLTAEKHCQFISHSLIDHISFLHADTIDGAIIAGGTRSNQFPDAGTIDQASGTDAIYRTSGTVHQTSFDLTLPPGVYYYDINSDHGIEGPFDVTLLDNCTNEIERPFTFDDDGVDAFGNTPPLHLIDLTSNCEVACDSASVLPENVAPFLSNGDIEFYYTLGGGRFRQSVYNFTWLKIQFPFAHKLKKMRIAGNNYANEFFLNNNVELLGSNDAQAVNDSPDTYTWTAINTLNKCPTPGTIPVPGWILEQEFTSEEVPGTGFTSYLIRFSYRYSGALLTELEFYV